MTPFESIKNRERLPVVRLKEKVGFSKSEVGAGYLGNLRRALLLSIWMVKFHPRLNVSAVPRAVVDCAGPISGPNNLCNHHRLPGPIVQVDDSTMMITAWVAEHGDEVGIILLNDFALGDCFGGREGFEAELAVQGFSNVRNIATSKELEAAKYPTLGKKAGDWGGPWRTRYAWEVTSDDRDSGAN
jgi:hypothetical protein